jgi:hypothetical protein
VLTADDNPLHMLLFVRMHHQVITWKMFWISWGNESLRGHLFCLSLAQLHKIKKDVVPNSSTKIRSTLNIIYLFSSILKKIKEGHTTSTILELGSNKITCIVPLEIFLLLFWKFWIRMVVWFGFDHFLTLNASITWLADLK